MVQVTRRLTIPRPPDVVWRHLSTQEALRGWISPSMTIDLVEGGAFRVQGPDESTWVSGVVLDLVPRQRLALSWTEEGAGWAHPARLTITLEPEGGGTLVTLIHDGFAGIGTATWRSTADGYDVGVDRHALLPRLSEAVLAVA